MQVSRHRKIISSFFSLIALSSLFSFSLLLLPDKKTKIVLGKSSNSEQYWKQDIKAILLHQFEYCLTPSEMDPSYRLDDEIRVTDLVKVRFAIFFSIFNSFPFLSFFSLSLYRCFRLSLRYVIFPI